MTKLCAWCGLNMGQKEPLEDRRVSHGICPDCEMAMIAKDQEVESR